MPNYEQTLRMGHVKARRLLIGIILKRLTQHADERHKPNSCVLPIKKLAVSTLRCTTCIDVNEHKALRGLRMLERLVLKFDIKSMGHFKTTPYLLDKTLLEAVEFV